MQAALVMFKADGSRRDFPLEPGSIVVGRKNSCELRIPLSSVSRQHCEVTVDGDTIKLKDLGSSNGTYHNSIRVQEAELAAGDEVVVGPVVFTVVVDGEPSDLKPVRTVMADGGGKDDDAEPVASSSVSAEPAESDAGGDEDDALAALAMAGDDDDGDDVLDLDILDEPSDAPSAAPPEPDGQDAGSAEAPALLPEAEEAEPARVAEAKAEPKPAAPTPAAADDGVIDLDDADDDEDLASVLAAFDADDEDVFDDPPTPRPDDQTRASSGAGEAEAVVPPSPGADAVDLDASDSFGLMEIEEDGPEASAMTLLTDPPAGSSSVDDPPSLSAAASDDSAELVQLDAPEPDEIGSAGVADAEIELLDLDDAPAAAPVKSQPPKPKKPKPAPAEVDLDDDDEEDPIAALEAMANSESSAGDSSIIEFDFDDLDDDKN